VFNKTRARIEKFEETNETFRKAKQHVEKYKVVYASIGASVTTAIVVKSCMKPQIITVVNKAAAPVFNNTVAPVIAPVMNNIANNAGHCTKVVQNLETGELWEKVNRLAEELAEVHGVSFDTARTRLSKHLNGHTDHVFGKQYRTIALGTTG